ncbi:MAG: radical SAM protein [Dehalococcoidia bacterium]|nr:radical SAM protein [Dehalococcoidia bacterium]
MTAQHQGIRTFPRASKVLLIEPPNSLTVGFNATVVVEPLALEYVAAAVSDITDVAIYDMRVDPMPLADALSRYQPDAIGIREGYTVDVDTVRSIATAVKKIAPNVPIIVGGHHVSLSPQDASIPAVDAIVVGDGEIPFRNLIVNLQKFGRIDNTPDVIFQDAAGRFDDKNVIVRATTSLKQFDSAVMNERPIPARHLVDQYRPSYFFLYHESPYSIESARGCIYRCNFCSVHQFHKGAYRVQSANRTLDELQRLPRNAWVNVVDDLAIQELPAAQKKQYPAGFDPMEQMAEDLTQMNLGQRYWMQVRADNVVRNPKKFEKWARAGLDTVLIGLESFEQADLDSVSKGTKSGDNERALEILNDLGIRIWGAVIIFQQWAEQNFDHLKSKVMEHKIEFPQFTIMTPLPGTGQWRDTEHQLITREPRFFDFCHSVLPTRLSPRVFYEQYASTWRTVGGGGLDRARRMMQEVSTSKASVSRFLRQYRTLSSLDSYTAGIEMLERAQSQQRPAGSPAILGA